MKQVQQKTRKIILLNKKEGETPLEALSLFRKKHKEHKDTKMTYAGRLDPMASGILLVLVGEECKNKEKYLNLDKEYEFEVLFGFATDTYDILGKIIKSTDQNFVRQGLTKLVKNNMKYFTGELTQKYPLYSSKTVAGKQLWQYARDGEEVEAPEREVLVKSLKLVNLESISSKKLLADIEKRIKKVSGDFRQKEIVNIWRKELTKDGSRASVFWVGAFKIKCTSGTYVRGIANSLGEKMGLPALAYKIKRTKIGKWSKVE